MRHTSSKAILVAAAFCTVALVVSPLVAKKSANSVVVVTPGAMATSIASGYTENIDAFTFGTAAGTTTFDFEPSEPATKDSCKKGGWAALTRADGSGFKNQGDCVQYMNTGK
jgi:hypothetical protein